MTNLVAPLSRVPAELRSFIYNSLAVIYTMSSLVLLQAIRLAVLVMQPILKVSGLRKAATSVPGAMVLVVHTAAISILVWNRHAAEDLGTQIMLPTFMVLSATMATALRNLNRFPFTIEEIERSVRQSFPERWFSKQLRNPIDAHFVRIAIYSSITMVPAWATILFASTTDPWPFLYFIVCYSGNAYKHENLDHTNMHNRLFLPSAQASPGAKVLLKCFNFYLAYILNPACLRIPFFYDVQHVYVHHVENNGPEDTQSTVIYDRTSFIDFCKFSISLSLDFSFGIRVIRYLVRKGKIKPLKILLSGMLFWVLFLIAIALFNTTTAVFVFLARFFVVSAGAPDAYSWHGFADPDDPENIYRNSINLVVLDEHGNLGASFHLEHHVKPSLHWSKVADFSNNQRIKHMSQKSLTWFYGGGYYSGATLLKALWLNKLEYLLPLVSIDSKVALSREEILAVLKARTRPITEVSHSRTYIFIDRTLGKLAATALIWAPLPPENFRVDVPAWKADQMRVA